MTTFPCLKGFEAVLMNSMQINMWLEYPTDFSALDFLHCLILSYWMPPNYKLVFFYVYINSQYVVSSKTWSETVAFTFFFNSTFIWNLSVQVMFLRESMFQKPPCIIWTYDSTIVDPRANPLKQTGDSKWHERQRWKRNKFINNVDVFICA